MSGFSRYSSHRASLAILLCAGVLGAATAACGSGGQADTAAAATSNIKVTLSNPTLKLMPGVKATLKATVEGTSSQAVTWSCVGGSVTAEGVYTAPLSYGTFTVKAASVADPSRSATCTVTVDGTNPDWAGYAAPSVHLGYEAPAGCVSFSQTVQVQQSERGSYFMVAGWSHGYFGMQELADGKKVVICSLWDSSAQQKDALVEWKADGVRSGRFGGEGEGVQSFYDYAWKVGVDYRFELQAEVKGDRTHYTGWIFTPEQPAGLKLVTLSVPAKGDLIRDPYSFVEDFLRDGVGPELTRRAWYGPGQTRTLDGKVAPVLRARFTDDGNTDPRKDGGVTPDGKRFYLATGGTTKNTAAAGTWFVVK